MGWEDFGVTAGVVAEHQQGREALTLRQQELAAQVAQNQARLGLDSQGMVLNNQYQNKALDQNSSQFTLAQQANKEAADRQHEATLAGINNQTTAINNQNNIALENLTLAKDAHLQQKERADIDKRLLTQSEVQNAGRAAKNVYMNVEHLVEGYNKLPEADRNTKENRVKLSVALSNASDLTDRVLANQISSQLGVTANVTRMRFEPMADGGLQPRFQVEGKKEWYALGLDNALLPIDDKLDNRSTQLVTPEDFIARSKTTLGTFFDLHQYETEKLTAKEALANTEDRATKRSAEARLREDAFQKRFTSGGVAPAITEILQPHKKGLEGVRTWVGDQLGFTEQIQKNYNISKGTLPEGKTPEGAITEALTSQMQAVATDKDLEDKFIELGVLNKPMREMSDAELQTSMRTLGVVFLAMSNREGGADLAITPEEIEFGRNATMKLTGGPKSNKWGLDRAVFSPKPAYVEMDEDGDRNDLAILLNNAHKLRRAF